MHFGVYLPNIERRCDYKKCEKFYENFNLY